MLHRFNQSDLIEQFRQFGSAGGFDLPPNIVGDGKVQRFATNGKRGDDAGRYCLHLDGVPNGWIMDMRTGRKVEWTARGQKPNAKERVRADAEIKAAKAQRKAEKSTKRARAKVEAERILKASTPARADHTYLVSKGVKPHGLLEYDGELVVPLWRDSETVGLQFIDADGNKRFLPGSDVKGAHFIIGEMRDVLCICEGVATGLTIHQETGFAVAVALNAGNLEAVAKAFEGFPGEVIVCADDDWKRSNKQTGEPENIGLIKARQAASFIGACLAVPAFPPHRGEKDTDFNDLARLLAADGPEAVRRCIADAAYVRRTPDDEGAGPDEGEPSEPHDAFKPICAGTLLKKQAPLRQWVVPGLIPKNQVTLLAGDGGTGKSTLGMQLGIASAIGTSWLEIEVERTATLILSAEDDKDEMHWRCEKILGGLPGDRESNRAALEGKLWLLDATNELDPTLATYQAERGAEATDTFTRIERFIREHNIGLFIADSAADVFAEEIERHAVRSFIRKLKSIGCTVLLLGHPSVDGMKSGRGYSGSTHWNNAVRSRLYFTRVEAQDGSTPDPDLRVLVTAKANRARTGQKIGMRWTESGFVRENTAATGIDTLAHQLKAEEVFLKLLRQRCQEGRPPSHNASSAGTYAPKLFAAHHQSEGISKAAFAKAMDMLLSAGTIEIVTEGPPSKRRSRLKVKEAA